MAIPTLEQIEESGVNMDTITEEVESQADTLLDQYGKTRTTMTGRENALNDFNADASSSLGALGGVHIGEYSTDPLITERNQYVTFGVSPTATQWKITDSTSLDYQIDSTTYPDPEDDPSLIMFNDVTREWTQQNFKMSIGDVADIVNLPLTIGAKVFWAGYYAASDGGSNWGVIKSGAHVADGLEIFTIAANYYVQANLVGTISPMKAGILAGAVTAVKLQNLLDKATGRVKFGFGLTYDVDGGVSVNGGSTEININGSTINFTTSTYSFYDKSNKNTIHNGTISTDYTPGTGGNAHQGSCITIGDQVSGAGNSGFTYKKLTLSTNRTDAGATISVIGECALGSIRQIKVPDNALCRNIIGIEWGGNPGGVGDTGHPHDITVKGIECGALTHNNVYPSFGQIVWISSAFNINVSNLYADEAYGIVSVYAGDKGNDFAPTRYKDLVGTGISVKNAVCNKVYGSAISTIGKGGSTVNIVGIPVSMKNIHAKASTAATGVTYGWSGEQFSGPSLEKFSLKGFDNNVSLLSFADHVKIADGYITDGANAGVLLGSTSNKADKPVINNVVFHRNNKAGGTGATTAACYLLNTRDADVAGCTFGEEGVQETQKYSIAMGDNTRRPLLDSNHTHSVAAGGFAILAGTTAATYILAHGQNNTADAGVSVHAGSPIFSLMPDGTKQFTRSAAPTSGAYVAGDKCYITTPATSADALKVCTVSGTPGTWV